MRYLYILSDGTEKYAIITHTIKNLEKIISDEIPDKKDDLKIIYIGGPVKAEADTILNNNIDVIDDFVEKNISSHALEKVIQLYLKEAASTGVFHTPYPKIPEGGRVMSLKYIEAK